MRHVDFFRSKYPYFFYQRYSWTLKRGNLQISFDFSVPPDVKLQSKILVKNVSQKDVKRVGESAINNLVFHLGMAELFSYWKATCSPEIIVNAGPLKIQQINWWKDLLLQGMGEFFYQNKIDFTQEKFIQIISPTAQLSSKTRANPKLKPNILIPLGGGKDSIVTLELLKKSKQRINAFVLNPKQEQKQIIKIAGLKNPVIVERTIDPKLLELNRKGFLNGHTPFSAYLAFLGALCAVLFDFKYIAVSNERSSNEGNIEYMKKSINHQYSKTYDFEKKFRQYSKKYLVKDIEYFSFLRPLYEVQIAKLFSGYPKYFSPFLSCNEAHKTHSGTKKATGKWCGKCPKCLFVFTALYVFLEEKQLVKIFKKNLFQDRSLIPLMEELVGELQFKPFECVGTTKESLGAFYLSLQKLEGTPSALLNHFKKEILPRHKNLEVESKRILASWNNRHFIPFEFTRILKREV
ncbi:hypothetical protein IID24_02020 [Patescibacteria group bacterium]|nr:hypothetical protein [Patescibacteria group bacterium]